MNNRTKLIENNERIRTKILRKLNWLTITGTTALCENTIGVCAIHLWPCTLSEPPPLPTRAHPKGQSQSEASGFWLAGQPGSLASGTRLRFRKPRTAATARLRSAPRLPVRPSSPRWSRLPGWWRHRCLWWTISRVSHRKWAARHPSRPPKYLSSCLTSRPSWKTRPTPGRILHPELRWLRPNPAASARRKASVGLRHQAPSGRSWIRLLSEPSPRRWQKRKSSPCRSPRAGRNSPRH